MVLRNLEVTMKITHFNDVLLEDVNIEGADRTKIRWLISQKDNAPHFAMRMFEVEAGGHTPFHSHDWEHEVFVLQGTGTLVTEEGEKPFQQWDVIYVEPHLKHQFKNTDDTLLRFLCVVPHPNQSAKVSRNPLGDKPANNC